MNGTPNLPPATKIFLKKNYVSYLKSVKKPIIRMGSTGSTQNVKKIVATSNHPIRAKKISTKVCLVP
jgi:hypothetical protein